MIHISEMLEVIRKKFLNKEYKITKHAQKRCDTRGISLEEIKQVITTGETIETYPYEKFSVCHLWRATLYKENHH